MCAAVQVQIAMVVAPATKQNREVGLTREHDSVARAAVSVFAAVRITAFTAISLTGLFAFDRS
jgi:hypothetical protein